MSERNVHWEDLAACFGQARQHNTIIHDPRMPCNSHGVNHDGVYGFPSVAEDAFRRHWDVSVPKALMLFRKIHNFIQNHPEKQTIPNISTVWPMLFSINRLTKTCTWDGTIFRNEDSCVWEFCWNVEFVRPFEHGLHCLQLANNPEDDSISVYTLERPNRTCEQRFSFVFDVNQPLPKKLTKLLLLQCV